MARNLRDPWTLTSRSDDIRAALKVKYHGMTFPIQDQMIGHPRDLDSKRRTGHWFQA